LYVLCLPNEHQTKLFKAENKYGQQVNDMAASKQKGSSNTVKKAVANEYDQTEIRFTLTTYYGLPDKIYLHFTSALLHYDADSALRPPQA